jgi:hypothetical protein
MLEKYDFLKQLGVRSRDLSCLSENRKKKWAFLAGSDSNAHLQRMLPVRRYPVLVCFLKESLLDITDVIMMMYSDYWQQIINKSGRALDNCPVKTVKSQQGALQTIIQTGKWLLMKILKMNSCENTSMKYFQKCRYRKH